MSAAAEEDAVPQFVVPVHGVVYDSQAKAGAQPKFELLGVLGFSPDGIVSGNWDIKPYNEANPHDESEMDSNVVRGHWNADTNQVFLDEYDLDGNITTAKISGTVSFTEKTLEACDEDCDYWELKIISSLTQDSTTQKSS